MLSADYRAAKALMELRAAEVPGRVGASESERSFAKAPQLGPGQRLVRRVALLLVSSGGRLVQVGLPPYRPAGMEMSAYK